MAALYVRISIHWVLDAGQFPAPAFKRVAPVTGANCRGRAVGGVADGALPVRLYSWQRVADVGRAGDDRAAAGRPWRFRCVLQLAPAGRLAACMASSVATRLVTIALAPRRRAGSTRMVGDWELGQQIGIGSFSVVWYARNLATGQEAAVKEIPLGRLDAKLRQVSWSTMLASFPHSPAARPPRHVTAIAHGVLLLCPASRAWSPRCRS